MLEWNAVNVKIKDLKEYPHNPRKMTKKEYEKLIRSIKEDGYHQRIMVDSHNVIIGGHQRKKALIAAGFKANDTIQVLKPNRELSEEEFDRINIRDNLPFGMYDFDILSSRFEVETLANFGMDESLMIGFGGEEDAQETDRDDKEECDCDCCRH